MALFLLWTVGATLAVAFNYALNSGNPRDDDS